MGNVFEEVREYRRRRVIAWWVLAAVLGGVLGLDFWVFGPLGLELLVKSVGFVAIIVVLSAAAGWSMSVLTKRS